MRLEPHNYLRILNSLPILVILIFGMLALHSAVVMIDISSELSNDIKPTDLVSELHVKLIQKNLWLYWSVIAIGFSSFLLALLNSNKLIQLRKINCEKDQVVSVMESSLSALEVAQEGIFISDNQGLVSYVNKSFYIINGLDTDDREEFIGKPWLNIFSDTNRYIIEKNILSEFNDNGCWLGDLSMYSSDDSNIHVDLSLTVLPNGGLIGTIQDVSKKYQAEKDKKSMEDQFYQAQKMEAIGRLAGGIAHDFNNILAAMNGYAEFLKEDLPDDSEQQKFAINILQAGMQARELVDQMLSFSRTTDSERKPLDLIISVSEAITMIKATASKSIDITHNFTIPYAPIFGNPTQLSQLIMNLCVNAMDAMEEDRGALNITVKKTNYIDIGYPRFVKKELPDPKENPIFRIDDIDAGHARLHLGHIAQGYDYVVLSVRDSGTGISRVVMDHIFEPFFTTKPVDKGTGLGLSTVHGIVVSHSGFMIVDSILGKGTVFELYFHLVEGVNSISKGKEEEDINSISKDSLESKKHILLVEDQENVRSMVILLLQRLGFEVSFAVSGLDGLDMIRENPTKFDLVITDYNMPKMTGLEMVQQVHFDLPEIPFILLSGYSEDRIREIIDGHEAIKTVIRKPVSKTVLSAKIDAILDT